ncbi:hypothetical protein JAAARDRAFT_492938 [Jaapia argillacea MUCL 33604]|uniref:Uncharacterized protein n=1 Tax=Jaapia argillacea MUCL 33604 TaxID=933084 RepID=A0A067PAS5_9AGAM|nr:hypothetical protein JAAARDRAFT_492938 [Jaapia argillacea MUCL 33604]
MTLRSATCLVVALGILVVPSLALPIRAVLVCSPTTWADLLIFFGTNYFAHAATIPSVPGVPWYDTVAWTVIGLLLPFAGLGKSAGLVFRHFSSESGDLEKASARAALLVVCRSDQWEPSTQPEEIYVKLPDNFHQASDASSLPTAQIQVLSPDATTIVDHRSFRIHGGVKLPPGYKVAIPDSDTLMQYFPFRSAINKSIVLSRSQSYVKMAISVAQLVYSVITIYRTKGNQLERFGYAAFGLSVFPYAFMSLANFICIGVVGEYTHLYMLRTAVMREAKLRGGIFPGAIGSIKGEDRNGEDESLADGEKGGDPVKSDDGDDEKMLKARKSWAEFSRATISMEMTGPSVGDYSLLEKVLVIKVGGTTRKFRYLPPPKDSESGAPFTEYTFRVSQNSNQNAIPPGCYVSTNNTGLESLMACLALCIVPLALIMPYIVIYKLSGFHKGGSTASERFWMMAWVSSGQVVFLFFAIIGVVFPSFAISTLGDPALVGFFSLLLLPFAIPPIGGFVMVGKMLMEFGSCSLSKSPS